MSQFSAQERREKKHWGDNRDGDGPRRVRDDAIEPQMAMSGRLLSTGG